MFNKENLIKQSSENREQILELGGSLWLRSDLKWAVMQERRPVGSKSDALGLRGLFEDGNNL